MRLVSFFVFGISILSFTGRWHNNFDLAKLEAKQQHKFILLNFSGSDWCGPCIRLHKEIFDDSIFQQFADSSLVLINADFPRQKKNQLSKQLQHENDLLADHYNATGAFPLTLLLDADGRILKKWDGLPKQKPADFVNEIDATLHAINASKN
jgi:thioredoxin-related protein